MANEAQNSDLFWALRGGGAGSWGIVSACYSISSYAVLLILVASATIKVYPSVAIGASLLAILPSTSQNVTTLGIEFISFVARYQNWWINKGIASSFILFQDQYLLVCLLTIRPSVHQSPYTPVSLLAYKYRWSV